MSSNDNSPIAKVVKRRKSLENARNFIMDVFGAFKSDSAAEVVYTTFAPTIDPLVREEKERIEKEMRENLKKFKNGQDLLDRFDSKVYKQENGSAVYECNRKEMNLVLFNTMRNRIIKFATTFELSEDDIDEQIEQYDQEYKTHLMRLVPEYQDFYWQHVFVVNDSILHELSRDVKKMNNSLQVYKHYQMEVLEKLALDHFINDFGPFMAKQSKSAVWSKIVTSLEDLITNNMYDFRSFQSAMSRSTPIRYVMLGTGESGKSALCRQVRWIFGDQIWFQKEQPLYVNTIIANIIFSLSAIHRFFDNQVYTFENPKNLDNMRYITNIAESENLLLKGSSKWTSEVYDMCASILADKVFQEAFKKHASEFHVFDGSAYIFKEFGRFKPQSYVCTIEDALHSRRKTTGVVEITLPDGSQLVDTGGQRNERKKWTHLYDDRNCLFVVSLSEYDQTCYEDDTTNRMQESLDCFDYIINGPFKEKDIILVFTHLDMFKEKIQGGSSLSKAFPDYFGGSTWEYALEFVISKYLAVDKYDVYRITYYYCDVMDRDEVGKIIRSILCIEPYVQTIRTRTITLTRGQDVFFRFR